MNKELIIKYVCILLIGLSIGYLVGNQHKFNEDHAVDKVEYILNNINDFKVVGYNLDENLTLGQIADIYQYKNYRLRPFLGIMLRGVCTG